MKEVDLNQESDDLSFFLHKSNCRNKMDIVKSLCFAVCHRLGAKCESMPLNELDLQRGQMDKMRFNKLKSLKVAK